MECNVVIQLRPDILDPQGKAVLKALLSLGYDEVDDVRVGKQIKLTFASGDKDSLNQRVEQMAEQLLANPVIENFKIEWPK